MSEYVLLFVIANSALISIFPLLFLAHAHDSMTDFEKENLRISLATLNILIPLAMGIGFAVLYPLFRDFGIPRKVSGVYIRFALAGAITAGTLSILCDQFLDIYGTWFEMDNPWMIHLGVSMAYFLVYQVIGIWAYRRISDVFLEDEPAPSRSSSSSSSSSSSRSDSNNRGSSSSSDSSSVYERLSNTSRK